MFSRTIIASSTTIPIARTIPSNVKTLIVKSAIYITKKAPISEIGIAITGIIVERQSLKKRKIIKTTRANAMIIVCSTSAIDSLIKVVTSNPIVVVISAGRFFLSMSSRL
jgi:hypothetical protein